MALHSLFLKEFNGTHWNQQQKLTRVTGGIAFDFGSSLVIQNNFIVVGSPNDPDDAFTDNYFGHVYTFSKNGTNWVGTQKIYPADRKQGDLFGFSVSINGDFLVASSPYCDQTIGNTNYSDQGCVYIFKYNSTHWNEHQKLISSIPSSQQYFGSSVFF